MLRFTIRANTSSGSMAKVYSFVRGNGKLCQMRSRV